MGTHAIGGEPFLQRAPGRDSLVVQQVHQLSPDERGGLYVIGAAAQCAYPTAEIPSEGPHAAAGQIRQESAGNVVRADNIEGRRAVSQRAEKWLLEPRKVNDRWRRLPSQSRGLVGELAPGNVRIDAILRHPFGNARKASDGGGNALAARKCDEPHVCLCCRDSRSCPAHLEEMPMGSGGGCLKVDDQHLEVRERFRNSGHHVCEHYASDAV